MSSRFLALAVVSTLGWLTGCGEDSTLPEAPCELACGEHGTCTVTLGSESCACDEGYEGANCTECTDGFVSDGGTCLADPCEPNPCTGPHQSLCQPAGASFECICDDDAQDNDGDGTCRPACDAFADHAPGQSCDDSSGLALFVGGRTCATTVRFAPDDGNLAAVSIAGEFNGWRQDQSMVRGEDGVFEATLALDAGDYAYKFYLPGTDAWIEDPGNPYSKWVDGIRNSRLRVADCQRPALRLLHEPDATTDRISFQVQAVSGGAGGTISSVEVTRNDTPITANFDAATGVVTVDDGPLSPGKYAYRLRTSDDQNRPADMLYVPVWIEDTRFEWEDAVMYFVFTDRFMDGNPGNNAPVPGIDPKANWQGGDFAGLRTKMEESYFEQLGVNALWISSISHNTGRGGTGTDGRSYAGYHSYWPISTGWTGGTPLQGVEPVDPHFGTLEEFKALVEYAHSKGIRVLVDFVANHVHEDSPLWQQNQNSGWFHTPAQGCEETGWTKPIECWFAFYLPDFEYKNTEVMKRVADHAIWLVRETDIDGFRLDAVKHMIGDFTHTLRGRIDEEMFMTGQRFYMVGETFTGEDGADQLKAYIGPDQLDGQFDFPLYWQITSVFMRQERDLRSLENMVGWSEGFYGDFAVMSTFLGNHDVCRAISQANGDFGDMWCNGGKEQGWVNPPGAPAAQEPYDRLKLAWTFMMTAPGIPLIYYGDEYGMPGAGDPDNRRGMQFGADLSGLQADTLAHVQKLTAIRHQHRALRYGKRQTLAMGGDGLDWVYAMRSPDDGVAVAINRSGNTRTVTFDPRPAGLDKLGSPVDALGGLPIGDSGGQLSVELGPHQSAVIVFE